MSATTITHTAAAVFAGVLVWLFQEARLGVDIANERLKAGQYREQIAAEQRASERRVAKVSADVAGNYQGALNDAISKQATLQAAAERSRREHDSLRKQLFDAERRLADASAPALIEYANTTNELLEQCSNQYSEVAAKADAHAADAASCRAAWPVFTIEGVRAGH